MKLVEVLELREGLKAVAALSLPVKVAYRLAKVVERVEAEGKRFDGLRQKLFEKHGEKHGDRIEVAPEKQGAFGEEMNELLLLDSELVVEPCVTIEELGDVRVAAADLARCRAIIKDA